MTTDEQRIAIAKACGWRKDKRGLGWLSPRGDFDKLPDYLNDLNAMHEAEIVIPNHMRLNYWKELDRLRGHPSPVYELISSTAAQRAEAFLKALGLWRG